jgi:protein TonB
MACANGEHDELTRYGTLRCRSIDGAVSPTKPAAATAVTLHATEPVLLYSVDPNYPPEAMHTNVQGECLVGLLVDSSGAPQDVHIVKSLSPLLDAAALAAVRRYRFKPATLNGDPVPERIDIVLTFHVASR